MRATFIVKQETLPIIASGSGRRSPNQEERRQMAEELRRKHSDQLAHAPRWKVILIHFKIALDAWCLDLHRLYQAARKRDRSR